MSTPLEAVSILLFLAVLLLQVVAHMVTSCVESVGFQVNNPDDLSGVNFPHDILIDSGKVRSKIKPIFRRYVKSLRYDKVTLDHFIKTKETYLLFE